MNVYQKCLRASDRVNWSIDEVIRGRDFDFSKPFLPNALSCIDDLDIEPHAKLLLSHVQGRTYVNLFKLGERFIEACIGSSDARGADAVAALGRFQAEEAKHQALFALMETMLSERMPPGYRLVVDSDVVLQAVQRVPRWAALGLICHIELFTQRHYLESLRDADVCPLWKDVFKHHWLEESQHTILDEHEWRREAAFNGSAVGALNRLLQAADQLLSAQARADARYFRAMVKTSAPIEATLLKAYRRQYLDEHPRFQKLRTELSVTEVRPLTNQQQQVYV